MLFTIIFYLLTCMCLDAKASSFLANDTIPNDSIWKSTVLDSVEVIGSNVIHKLDRDIWTFTDEMREGTYDTKDILNKIPGFSYDYYTRQLTFMGDGKIVLLIDGREKGNGFIGNMANIRFSKAEVLLSPTGRYQGYRAVVNLITKENWTGFDLNSTIQTVVAPTSRYGEKSSEAAPEVNYTYTSPRTDISVLSAYRHENRGLNVHRECVESNAVSYSSTDEGKTTDWKYDNLYNIGLDVDYRLGQRRVLSAKYQYLDRHYHAGSSNLLTKTHLSDMSSSIINRTTRSGNHDSNHIWSVYYRGNNGKWSLYADATYDLQDSHVVYGFIEEGYATFMDNHEERNILKLNLDVSKSYENGRFNFGLLGNYRKYTVTEKNTGLNSKYNEYKSRWFLNVSHRLSTHLSARIGGFLEPAYIKNMLEEGEGQTRWGGNAYLNYSRIESKTYVSLHYNLSVDYPRLAQMSSIRYQVDSLLARMGNASIKPVSLHTVELMGVYKNFQLSVSYDFSNDWITNVYKKDGDLTVQTYDNTRYSHLLAIGSYKGDIKLGKNRLTYETNVYYTRYHRSYGSQHPTNSSWGGYANTSFKHHNWGLFGLAYYSRSVTFNTLQGESRYRQDERWILSYLNWFAKGRVLISVHYVLPVKWGLRLDSYSCTDTPFYSHYQQYNDFDAISNSFMIRLTYRIAKGRQVNKLHNKQNVEKETVPDYQ